MGAPFDELTAGRRAFVARASLSELAILLGRPGRAALAARPDLVAQIDQHVAAIRDALGNLVEPVALAGYAAALRDAARVAGDTLETWGSPSWMMLRLLAVCVLSNN
jgi:ABC-type Fe3+-hydroxamate transport system substrate-binding protein